MIHNSSWAKLEIILTKTQQETISSIDEVNKNGNIEVNCDVKQELTINFEDWRFQSWTARAEGMEMDN